MEAVLKILGQGGIATVIGLMIFIPVFKNAQKLFDWIEDQTIGVRNFILESLEKLFIEIPPEKVTYGLIGLAIFSFFLMILIFGIILGAWGTSVILGLLASFLSFKLPKPVLNYLIEKRIQEYSGQMVDALTLLSNGIRAGLSMPQALGMVAAEMPAPTAQEYNLILQQQRIGVPLEECLENLSARIPTEDNDMFVSGVNILKETGGNLAETFDTIVDVIRERVRIAQKIEQYTASGMFQGMTIAAMPFGLGGIYFVTDPASMERVFAHPLGIALMIAAMVLDGIGFFVILKIVKIKV
jgi:tight adherence protein B